MRLEELFFEALDSLRKRRLFKIGVSQLALDLDRRHTECDIVRYTKAIDLLFALLPEEITRAHQKCRLER